MLSHLGRREEALAASQEATDIQRRLVKVRPETFLPGLAASLSSLGVRLSDLGRFDEALAASQEAVDSKGGSVKAARRLSCPVWRGA